MSAHRILYDMLKAPHAIPDPGAGGTITCDRQFGICEMTSKAAETRTLANPTKPGLRLTVRLKVDGGDVTVTAANGLNVAGNTTAVFGDAGDLLYLVSVSHTTGYRWEILVNTGVTLA